jgi:hypothetical protein
MNTTKGRAVMFRFIEGDEYEFFAVTLDNEEDPLYWPEVESRIYNINREIKEIAPFWDENTVLAALLCWEPLVDSTRDLSRAELRESLGNQLRGWMKVTGVVPDGNTGPTQDTIKALESLIEAMISEHLGNYDKKKEKKRKSAKKRTTPKKKKDDEAKTTDEQQTYQGLGNFAQTKSRARGPEWKDDDDMKLLEAVGEYGNKWSKILHNVFPNEGRSAAQIKGRYKKLTGLTLRGCDKASYEVVLNRYMSNEQKKWCSERMDCLDWIYNASARYINTRHVDAQGNFVHLKDIKNELCALFGYKYCYQHEDVMRSEDLEALLQDARECDSRR